VNHEIQSDVSPSAALGGSSIEEGRFVDVHGVEQWVSIRGSDVKNPVLLIVAGPGAGISRMAPFLAPWEKEFTLVQWDQPRAEALVDAESRISAPSNSTINAAHGRI